MRISDWSSDVCSSDLGFPAIEVAACATNVDLAVDRTAATQQLAGRPQKSAAVDRRVRLLAIAPVVSRMADQSREADRQLHQHGFGDRKSVGTGTSGAVRVELGGRRKLKKKKKR